LILIPAEVIMTYDEQRRMVVSRPKSLVAAGPSFRGQGEVTPEFEERVRRHYGLSSAPSTEGRGGYDALTGAEEQPAGRHGDSGAVGHVSDLGDTDELKVLRSEEKLRVGTREREAGAVRVRKRLRTDRERMEVPTRREEVCVDRVPVETEAPPDRSWRG
jgi:stress response protein YsnF